VTSPEVTYEIKHKVNDVKEIRTRGNSLVVFRLKYSIESILKTFYLDLQPCDVADGESKESSQRHGNPKTETIQFGIVDDERQLAENDHHGDEEDDSVDVVVESKKPDAVIHFRKDALDVDSVERDEK